MMERKQTRISSQHNSVQSSEYSALLYSSMPRCFTRQRYSELMLMIVI